ncbi:DNA-binding protein [Staphylotrichum tortipilum]|uniref:DNA-binding protein n=1 Tax=Staphylotrichum tortipilum TaxID=2831512 RepID=A0AAN6MJ83_9PEZI|nr:DNA-binding protein [Staphylotrichum longicolle]
MPPQDPNPNPNPHDIDNDDGDDTNVSSLSLDHAHILLTSFNSFLTVAIHNILYYRRIYPPQTFLSTKAYNLPVHQSRHPKVCAWIRDAVDAVAVQLSAGHVSRIAIVIHSPLTPAIPPNNPPSSSPSPFTLSQSTTTPSSQQPTSVPPGSVLERWLITTSSLPSWPAPKHPSPNPPAAATSKAMRDFARVLARDARSEAARERHLAPDTANPGFHWPDLDEQLRGALRRMAVTAEGMAALPVEGCGFTVAVEMEEGGRAPIGHPQPWIPSEPNLQPRSKGKDHDGEDLGGVKTRPIRAVEAGPLFFECWVEEGRAKEVLMAQMKAAGS